MGLWLRVLLVAVVFRCSCPTGHEELGCQDSTDPSSWETSDFRGIPPWDAMVLSCSTHMGQQRSKICIYLSYLGFLFGVTCCCDIWLFV